MQSNNPVFNRSEGFNGRPYAGFGDGPVMTKPQTTYGSGLMTIDSVVQRTALSVGVVIVAALATWVLTPDLNDFTTDLGPLYAALMIGGIGAFALSMINSFSRVINPVLVLAFAALEGVAMGALSKLMDAQFGGSVISGAVIGTFAAFAGTLAAYKFFNIRVGNKFRTIVTAAMFGMVGLALMELVLSLFGSSLGLFGFGTLGLLTAVAGLVLGIFMLVMDFDFVERGIAAGLPERESWRAAFAMTVSLIWIYQNLLRLLAILRD
ncbi:Bax inhibitor-1/YccA family membrane protein [Nocardioides sp. Kera G14]|uniref:Bax inhibitor-1/YccA family protein n=1 Tax=Nocardioides sp. Kera G14 TaxID=2884264 RepID=UPI001D11D8D9|nr:Bax inhibitor-1/YccA family protein [Nocardioides sp. Kera G14]UDY22982.1 Bax inhibitor-1/YccA family protein [Nocardioides sp. Kera G14]